MATGAPVPADRDLTQWLAWIARRAADVQLIALVSQHEAWIMAATEALTSLLSVPRATRRRHGVCRCGRLPVRPGQRTCHLCHAVTMKIHRWKERKRVRAMEEELAMLRREGSP